MSSSALPAKAARSLRTFKADRSRSVANTPAANPMGRAGTGGVTAVSVMLKAAAAVRLQAAAGHNSTAGRHVSARTASVPAVKIERRRWVKNLTKDIRENPKEFNG